MAAQVTYDPHSQLRALYQALLSSQDYFDEFKRMLQLYSFDPLQVERRADRGGRHSPEAERSDPELGGRPVRRLERDADAAVACHRRRRAVQRVAVAVEGVERLLMNIHELVDDLYEAFADRIGEPLSDSARDLPRALRLAPQPVPWSRVFSHEVTLGAPALFAEAMAGVPSSTDSRCGSGAPACGDRCLRHRPHRRRTDRELARRCSPCSARLGASGTGPWCASSAALRRAESDFRAADALSLRAIRAERAMLAFGSARRRRGTTRRASLDKQCAGILASVALARAAGWTERRCRAVRATLGSVWLGLQIADDVVDWEDDVQRGGAWAVCLMRGLPAGERPRGSRRSIRTQVLQSGVLAVMLAASLCAHAGGAASCRGARGAGGSPPGPASRRAGSRAWRPPRPVAPGTPCARTRWPRGPARSSRESAGTGISVTSPRRPDIPARTRVASRRGHRHGLRARRGRHRPRRRDLTLALARVPDALAPAPSSTIETLIARAPLFWTRVRASTTRRPRDALARRPRRRPRERRRRVRYVAPARVGSMALAPPLDLSGVAASRHASIGRRARGPPGPARALVRGALVPGRRGRRGPRRSPRLRHRRRHAPRRHRRRRGRPGARRPRRARARRHRPRARDQRPRGPDGGLGRRAPVAPTATRFVGRRARRLARASTASRSPASMWCRLPLAIARAVFDGADVVVCATYVEGHHEPHARRRARRRGAPRSRRPRHRRGAARPGRETVERGQVRARQPLARLRRPGQRPARALRRARRPAGRMVSVASRRGASSGRSRTAGPAVRWLAPGDDLAYPFSSRDRLFHAESSGASAIAAGRHAPASGSNPGLRLRDVHALLARTVDVPEPRRTPEALLADPADVLPSSGTTRRSQRQVAATAGSTRPARARAPRDPVALGLAAIGEDDAGGGLAPQRRAPLFDRLGALGRPRAARPARSGARRPRARCGTCGSSRPSRRAPGRTPRGRSLGSSALVARELMRMRPPAPVQEELEAVGQRLAGRGGSRVQAPALEEPRGRRSGVSPANWRLPRSSRPRFRRRRRPCSPKLSGPGAPRARTHGRLTVEKHPKSSISVAAIADGGGVRRRGGAPAGASTGTAIPSPGSSSRPTATSRASGCPTGAGSIRVCASPTASCRSTACTSSAFAGDLRGARLGSRRRRRRGPGAPLGARAGSHGDRRTRARSRAWSASMPRAGGSTAAPLIFTGALYALAAIIALVHAAPRSRSRGPSRSSPCLAALYLRDVLRRAHDARDGAAVPRGVRLAALRADRRSRCACPTTSRSFGAVPGCFASLEVAGLLLAARGRRARLGRLRGHRVLTCVLLLLLGGRAVRSSWPCSACATRARRGTRRETLRVLFRATATPYFLVGFGVLVAPSELTRHPPPPSSPSRRWRWRPSPRASPSLATTSGEAAPSSRGCSRATSRAAIAGVLAVGIGAAFAASLGMSLPRGAGRRLARRAHLGAARLLRDPRGRAPVLPRRDGVQADDRAAQRGAHVDHRSREVALAVERTVRRWLPCERVGFVAADEQSAPAPASRRPDAGRPAKTRTSSSIPASFGGRTLGWLVGRPQARRRALHERRRRPPRHDRQPGRPRPRARPQLRRARAAPAAAGRRLADRAPRPRRDGRRRDRARGALPHQLLPLRLPARRGQRHARRRGDRHRLRRGRSPRAPRLGAAPHGRAPHRPARRRPWATWPRAPRCSCATPWAAAASRSTSRATPRFAATPTRSPRCSSTSSPTPSTRAGPAVASA